MDFIELCFFHLSALNLRPRLQRSATHPLLLTLLESSPSLRIAVLVIISRLPFHDVIAITRNNDTNKRDFLEDWTAFTFRLELEFDSLHVKLYKGVGFMYRVCHCMLQ